MKRNIVRLYAFSFLMLSACVLNGQSDQQLNVNQFEEKLTNTQHKILLDVRTLEEYEDGHLPNAYLLDIHREDFIEEINRLDKSKPVFVYCASGVRSAEAAALLKTQGFKEVYDMDGGFIAWADANKPVVKD